MTPEVIRSRESLNEDDIKVLGMLAHNNSAGKICQKLKCDEQYLASKKRLISEKMDDPETQEGVCKAIIWAVNNDRIMFSNPHGFPSDFQLENDDYHFLIMIGRGMTKGQMARDLHISVNNVIERRERLWMGLGFKSVYPMVAWA